MLHKMVPWDFSSAGESRFLEQPIYRKPVHLFSLHLHLNHDLIPCSNKQYLQLYSPHLVFGERREKAAKVIVRRITNLGKRNEDFDDFPEKEIKIKVWIYVERIVAQLDILWDQN